MDAVVTAGGRVKGELAELTGQSIKCLIEFDGRRLIDIVLDALHGAAGVDRVCVVGPPEIRDSLLLTAEDLWVDELDSGHANFLLGLRTVSPAAQVVFATSDLPFVTSAAIDDLLGRCRPGYGVQFPAFTREEVRARFPHEANSYVRLVDGDLTGSSVIVFEPASVLAQAPAIEALFNARKDFLKLARIVGLDVGLRLLATMKFKKRLLSVDRLERRIGRVAGFPVRAVRGCDPGLGYDIDHERDWAECQTHLAAHPRG